MVNPGLKVRTPGSARAARQRATRRGRPDGPRLDAQVWPQAGSAGGRTPEARGEAAATGAGRVRASDRRCAGPRGQRATSAQCEGRGPRRTAPVAQRLPRHVGPVPAPLARALNPLSPSGSAQHPRGSNGPSGGPVLQARRPPQAGRLSERRTFRRCLRKAKSAPHALQGPRGSSCPACARARGLAQTSTEGRLSQGASGLYR
jgi:hypothetical protein